MSCQVVNGTDVHLPCVIIQIRLLQYTCDPRSYTHGLLIGLLLDKYLFLHATCTLLLHATQLYLVPACSHIFAPAPPHTVHLCLFFVAVSGGDVGSLWYILAINASMTYNRAPEPQPVSKFT